MRTVTSKARTPVGVNNRHVTRLLKRLSTTGSIEARLDEASGFFLEHDYAEDPLSGGPELKEVFRASLEAFECVTYMESVLALASSSNPDEFGKHLRKIRYRNGGVDWFERNHYMTAWLANNKRLGMLADLTRGPETIAKTRTLDVVDGLPPRRVTFRCFPKRRFAAIKRRMRTGDLILFVSTRRHLDVFHTGILIRGDDRYLMRHATRSAGKVIEQDLADFLKKNRMSGFILARPLCRP
ncbi:MAG TPA: N-acetylmuramoyl-L-alanine amidase-like domain-containing protein [Blastocatellia bacterium]|nr:N-acetylmuramoyl-L-alanine amidase-like domain-containing protein [Blastocatellia bacterium]